MTKNFDEIREAREAEDRSFLIGGETFTRKPGVRPEVLADYEKIETTGSAADTLAAVDGIIVQLIEPGDDAADRWRKLREREEHPVTLGDMTSIVQWLIEEETGRRPTQPASPSSRSRGTTSTR